MRLIDADEFRKRIDHYPQDIRDIAKKELRYVKTIDAEPIRHGHWIFTNKPNIYGGTSIKCSECGYEGMVAHIEDHHYCWFCGCKMDLKEVEE